MFGQKTLPEIRAELRARGFDLETLHREFRQLHAQPRAEKSEAELEAELNALVEQLKTLTASVKSR